MTRARELGLALIEALGQREAGTDDANTADEYAETRAKLFHLFARAHNQLRRAVVYLRWDEGDADAPLPSLFRGRPRKARSAGESGEPTTPEPGEPTPPEPGEPTTPEPGEPTTPEPGEPSEPAMPLPSGLVMPVPSGPSV